MSMSCVVRAKNFSPPLRGARSCQETRARHQEGYQAVFPRQFKAERPLWQIFRLRRTQRRWPPPRVIIITCDGGELHVKHTQNKHYDTL